MKKLCLVVLIALLTFPVLAQSQKGSVYLKNGTVLKGKFKFSNDLEKLKVETDGNVWIFNSNEIDSISYAKISNKKIDEDITSVSPVFFRTELGLLIGNAENSQSAPFSLSGSMNYDVNPNFSVGGGLGVEFLKETYMPVFLNLEYKLRDSYSTPYFFLKAGYQVAIDEANAIYYDVYPDWMSARPWPNYTQESLEAKGGVLINPGIGYQRMFSSSLGMTFAFGYQFHRLQFSGENDYGLDIDYNRLTMKLGIIFK